MKLMFFLFLGLFISGCEKQEVSLPLAQVPPKNASEPASNFVQMRFIFVNNGDSTLKVVNLESWFYRIHLDDSWYRYKYYPDIDPNDSICHYSDSSLLGSRKKFDVDLSFVTNGTITKKLRYQSALVSDTLKKAKDGLEVFRWPEDTVNYIKVYQWP